MKFSQRTLITLAGIVGLVFSAFVGADEPRAMTPRDLAQIQSMNSAKISPDGSLIAAVRSVPRSSSMTTTASTGTELYLIDSRDG